MNLRSVVDDHNLAIHYTCDQLLIGRQPNFQISLVLGFGGLQSEGLGEVIGFVGEDKVSPSSEVHPRSITVVSCALDQGARCFNYIEGVDLLGSEFEKLEPVVAPLAASCHELVLDLGMAGHCLGLHPCEINVHMSAGLEIPQDNLGVVDRGHDGTAVSQEADRVDDGFNIVHVVLIFLHICIALPVVGLDDAILETYSQQAGVAAEGEASGREGLLEGEQLHEGAVDAPVDLQGCLAEQPQELLVGRVVEIDGAGRQKQGVAGVAGVDEQAQGQCHEQPDHKDELYITVTNKQPRVLEVINLKYQGNSERQHK